jgi:hypothetical protein
LYGTLFHSTFLHFSAAKLGGAVLLTDGNADAIALAKNNVELNEVVGQCTVAPLPWGDSSAAADLQATFPRADLVIGSDILYSERAYPALLKTISMFADGDTKICLAYRPRYPAERGLFVEAAASHGYSVRHLGMYGGQPWEKIEMLSLSLDPA